MSSNADAVSFGGGVQSTALLALAAAGQPHLFDPDEYPGCDSGNCFT